MTKVPTELTHAIPLIHAARISTQTYKSTADDAGTSKRDSKYLLTKILNKITTLSEYSLCQIASALLNNKSYYSTNKFWICWVDATTTYQRSIQDINDIADVDSDSDYSTDDESDDSDDIDNEDLQKHPRDTLESYEDVHITKDRKVIKAAQHIHYRWRGALLRLINLYDYTSCISVVKKRKPTKKTTLNRRIPNKRIPFMEGHPMSDTHEQMIRSKILVPQIGERE